MSKLELKAAMDSLQVKTPLKLQVKMPVFKAPALSIDDGWGQPVNLGENPTQVIKPTAVVNPTQVELQTPVQNKSEVESSTVVTNPTQVNKPTPVQIETQVENQTPVLKETPVVKTTEVLKPIEAQPDQVSELRRATEQDSSVVLEARACEGLAKGYTRLPNSLLMKMANGDLTRGEIKILLLIARFTISFQRKLAPLSKTVLERQSGLRGAGVLEALSGLVAKKLIVKEQGDQHRPNMLGLVLPADWDQITSKSETPAVKSTQVQKPTAGEVAKTTPAPVENPAPFKDIKLYSNKNSHSQGPASLRKYFDEVIPKRKRETEIQAFRELKSDFAETDISLALEHLRKQGMPGSGEHCHSPMAYLAKAMGQILELAKAGQEKQRQKHEREEIGARARAEKAAQKDAEDERERQNAIVREEAFLRAFSTEAEQAEAIAKYGRKYPVLSQSGLLLRNLAITEWWESQPR